MLQTLGPCLIDAQKAGVPWLRLSRASSYPGFTAPAPLGPLWAAGGPHPRPTTRGRQGQKLVFCGRYGASLKFDTSQLHQLYGYITRQAVPAKDRLPRDLLHPDLLFRHRDHLQITGIPCPPAPTPGENRFVDVSRSCDRQAAHYPGRRLTTRLDSGPALCRRAAAAARSVARRGRSRHAAHSPWPRAGRRALRRSSG